MSLDDLEARMRQKQDSEEDTDQFVGSEDDLSGYEDKSDEEAELGDDDQHNGVHKEDELEELEREYSNLRNQEEDLLRNLKRNKEDDALKGQAVKNQKALWDRMLEIRILLQKVFTTANKLPQEPLRSSFSAADEEIGQTYTELLASSKLTLDNCSELQEALIKNNSAIKQVSKNGTKRNFNASSNVLNGSHPDDDEDWLAVEAMYSRIVPFRDSSIDKWQRKTQMTTGAAAFKSKLRAFNQNISQQVATNMRDPSKMITRMQMKRSLSGVVGDGPDDNGKSKEDPNLDGDPELLDDSEFYQQLLKEFLESFNPDSTENMLVLQKMRTKKRKAVDRRASKSRKIRYHVHEKIVNFMAPEPMDIPPMASKLFENLFGLKTAKS